MASSSDIARSLFLRLTLAALASALVACDGAAPTVSPAHASLPLRIVSGQVTKGPVDSARVSVFALDERGRVSGAALAQTVTDAMGGWSVALPASSGQLVVMSSGGRYVDEADPEPDPSLRRAVVLEEGHGFAAVLPDDATTVAVNIFTDALLRKSRSETEGANFFAVFAANRAALEAAFGFDLLDTMPADPIAPDPRVALASRRYAMALGGVANVVNDFAIANGQVIADFAIIDAVIRDLTDCVVDGRGVSGAIEDIVTVAADLNAQILRFRNNNFAAYRDTDLLVVNQEQCARAGRLGDTVAPVFTTLPADFSVAAIDASGILASAPAVQSGLASARASDDRDGELAPVILLPERLPLGATTVILRATDAAGNQADVSVVITVIDLDPPTIVAPPARDVAATGPMTAVSLGVPEVADNVSEAAALVVSNDAPVAGFAPGTTRVTWTVRDAAGLSATAEQTVTVRTAPPLLVGPLPDLEAVEGEAFSVNLGAAFADADSTLTYTLSALPAATGLSFERSTGVLAGVPTDADAKAAPLALSVTARDETTAVTGTFLLAITDRNNAPVFTLSGDLDLEEDFTETVFVDVVPAPVAAGDPNDVTYAISADDAAFVDLTIDPVSGRVSIRSRPDANGSGTFTITADDGASVNNTYSVVSDIRVVAVNDPPAFSLDRDSVEIVPGFSGSAIVDVIPAPRPADESGQTIGYRLQHRIGFARIDIDAVTGRISVSDATDLEASGIIEVIADDGQASANTHSEFLTLVVRDSDRLTLYVGEAVDGISAARPVFPQEGEEAIGFSALGLPDSLAIAPTSGELSGTPVERDAEVAVSPVVFTVTGSKGSMAVVPRVLHVVERDSDADGLPDRIEARDGTDATKPDSDGDGIGDGVEVRIGSNPLSDASAVRWLVPGDVAPIGMPPASGSAADPLIYALAPGTYESPVILRPPCDHVVVVGGISDEIYLPSHEARSVFDNDDESGVDIAGCTNVGLYHFAIDATEEGPAVSLRDASVHGAELALYRNLDGVLKLERSELSLAATVLSGNATEEGSGETVVLVDNSSLLYERGVIRHDASARVFSVDASSNAVLSGLLGNGSYSGAGRVVKTGATGGVVRHAPDHAKLVRIAEDSYVAELSYLGLRLGRGYVLNIVAGDAEVRVNDINGGDYLITTSRPLDGDIMLFIDGRPVAFVIE